LQYCGICARETAQRFQQRKGRRQVKARERYPLAKKPVDAADKLYRQPA
jgi:hypothetical protein